MMHGSPSARATAPTIPVLLFLAMAVWGINLSVVKALTATLDVMSVATVRMLVAAVALSVLLRIMGERLVLVRGPELALLVAGSVFMVYGNQILFAGGLARTSATNGALIMSLGPLLSSVLAAVALQERLHARRLAGIFIGFLGVACVILNRPGASLSGGSAGDALMLASVACFAGGGIAVQRLSRTLSPLQISWALHVIGGGLLTVHALLEPGSQLLRVVQAPPRTWLLILYSGVAATALAAVIWNRSISRLGAARTAVFFYWVPVFGVGFAALFLGEAITWWHGLGLASVIAGSRLASMHPSKET